MVNRPSPPNHDSRAFLLFFAILGPCISSSSTQLLDLFLPLETVLRLSGIGKLSCVGNGGGSSCGPTNENRLEIRLDSLQNDSDPKSRRLVNREEDGGNP